MANQNPGEHAGPHDAPRPGQVAGPLAGEPRRRRPPGAASRPWPRRAAAWLAWWVLLMSLWVAVDDSLESDELLVGAGVAAVAALLAELVTDQAEIRLRIRAAWLPRALGLPGQVVRRPSLSSPRWPGPCSPRRRHHVAGVRSPSGTATTRRSG